uniref:Si:dkey-120c6.5 n=1 Tax=Paramormyrops kingsleyae TaxID=1676925 RepID=A0A3B3SQI5_9TELE|nr:GTPase IMAP family member 4-like [Paramormyrops kingsleyae]
MASVELSAELRIVLFSSRTPLQTIVSSCILGRQVFMPAECSLSQGLKNHEETEGRKVSVITPNFFEKDLTQQHIRKELEGYVCLSCPGPHAVLLILDLEDISATGVRIVEDLTKYFGDDILKYTILLLCHEGKEEDSSLEDRLRKDRNFREILDKCGHQYHLFNKNSMEAKPLLERIEGLVAENGDRYFTDNNYEVTEDSIRKEQPVIETDRVKKIDKWLRKLHCMYQGEERERDQYLKSVRADGEEAEMIIHERRFAAQAMDNAAVVNKGLAVRVLEGAVLGPMGAVGGGVIGAVLGAVVAWKLWRR